MKNNGYPREITFRSPLSEKRSLFPAFRARLESALSKTRFILLDENTLQIDFPQDKVRQVRVVNIDDSIFRVDFILVEDPAAMHRVNLYPDTGWNHENFFRRGKFDNCRREDAPGRVVLTFVPTFSRYTERIPAWAICYIVNGDPSGLTVEEISMVDKWVRKSSYEVISPSGGQEYFCSCPAFGPAADVLDCDCLIRNK